MVAAIKDRGQLLWEAFHISSQMTARFYRMYRPEATMYEPEDIVPMLNAGKISYLVMGTHGVGAWRSEPRGTQDIDFLVVKRDHAKAVKIIREAFPKLEVIDATVVTRFRDPELDKVVIDFMRPNQPLFRVAFRNTIGVPKLGYRAPNLEFALASKFAAMVSHNRVPKKKHVDIGDFMDIVEFNKDAIDRTKLKKLGDLVYPNGGRELLKLVDDTLAGRNIQV